jgi:hypothetical protein
MKTISVLGLLLVALGYFGPGVQAHESFRVLAIHAYSQEYPWTKSQHRGFVEELTRNSLVPVNISTEYLDTKRRVYNEDYARQFRRYIQVKYTGYKPNIIYVTDDYGYHFARNYLLKLYPDAPIIFSGVNDYSIIDDIAELPIRGVFEKKDILRNLDLIQGLDEKGTSIIILGDGSSTYHVIESEIKQQLARYPNIYLKIHGLGEICRRNTPVTEPFPFDRDGLSILQMAYDAFGPEKIMWGSDYPPVSGREGYANSLHLPLAELEAKPKADLELIFGGVAAKVYGIA